MAGMAIGHETRISHSVVRQKSRAFPYYWQATAVKQYNLTAGFRPDHAACYTNIFCGGHIQAGYSGGGNQIKNPVDEAFCLLFYTM